MEQKEDSIYQELLKKIEEEHAKRLVIQSGGRRDVEPNLSNVSHALDELYILEKLKIYCSYLSYSLVVNKDVIKYNESSFRLMSNILKLVKETSIWHPAIQIYFKLSLLFEKAFKNLVDFDSDVDDFESIESLLHDADINFGKKDLIEIYSLLTNYATYQMNKGNRTFLHKNLKFHQALISLSKDHESNINTGAFKNMLVLILELMNDDFLSKEQIEIPSQFDSITEWAHEFIDQHKEYLPKPNGLKYYAYGKARIHFQSRKYQEAFSYVRNIERVREVFINLDIQILRLQLLVELEIEDDRVLEKEGITVEGEADKLRSLLKYDKLTKPKLAYQSRYYWEFLNLFRKFYAFFNVHAWMYKYGDKTYFTKREQLRNDIMNCEFTYKNWFLQKLECIK